MEKLCHPFVIDALLTWTPLIQDIALIIGSYQIPLYYNNGRRSNGWLGIQDVDTWLHLNTMSTAPHTFSTYMQHCFWYENKHELCRNRDQYILGYMGPNIFIYRVIEPPDYNKATWFIAFSMDSLLTKMHPQQFQTFLAHQHSRHLKELLT